MSETKFTTNPLTFEWEEYSGDDWLVAIADFGADGKAYITTDHVNASRVRLGDPKADVTLWTSARDLYAALEAIRVDYGTADPKCNCGKCQKARVIAAALRKARGDVDD